MGLPAKTWRKQWPPSGRAGFRFRQRGQRYLNAEERSTTASADFKQCFGVNNASVVGDCLMCRACSRYRLPVPGAEGRFSAGWSHSGSPGGRRGSHRSRTVLLQVRKHHKPHLFICSFARYDLIINQEYLSWDFYLFDETDEFFIFNLQDSSLKMDPLF